MCCAGHHGERNWSGTLEKVEVCIYNLQLSAGWGSWVHWDTQWCEHARKGARSHGSVAPITMFYFPRYDPIGTVYDVMVRFTSDLRTSMHLAASSAKIWDTGVPKRWPLTSSEHDSGRPGPGRASGATVSAQCSNRSPSKQGLRFRIQNAIFMDHIDPLFGAISLAVLSESHQWFASCDSDRFVEEKYFESPRVKWWRCTLDSQLAQKEQHLAA